MKPKNAELNRIRWIARITGTIMAVSILIFVSFSVAGEVKETGQAYSMAQILTFIFWGIAMLGLLLGLWKEGLGGVISLAGLALMLISGLFIPEANKEAMLWVVIILAVPGILYTYYWWESKKKKELKSRL
ncbi:MAG: hypothetical protein RBT38_12390 [Bacteroidales bacterium]|jgi:hypothetical protein|nr:hypothetical protein [Bacteroidales bacterium]